MLKIRQIILILVVALLTGCTASYQGMENTTSNTPTDNPLRVSINGNLWDDMQDNLQLPDCTQYKIVQQQIAWFEQHQGYLNRVIARAAPYIYYIYQQTEKRDLPAELALLPIIESAYNPFGYSKVGADGLWQIMPGTASGFGLKIDWWYDGRRDIIASTNAALHYFTYLHEFFNNDWLLAIAAYDSGEGTVQATIIRNHLHNQATNFWSLYLPQETRVYVPKLLALSAIIRDPDRYNIKLLPINDGPYLEQVDVGSQIDLNQAAKLADTSVHTMRALNPGFRRWATDPNGPYTLLIPIDKSKAFRQKLAALPKDKRVTWQEHTVKSGETVGGIVLKYKTKLSIVEQVNHLHNAIIRPGEKLLIPVAFHGSLRSPVVKQRATITEEKLPGPQRVLHIVQAGETLWTVADHYGVKVRELCFWNNINAKTALKPEQKLLIWAPPHSHLVIASHFTYKVQAGDSLGLIAKRYNTTSKKIRQINQLHSNLVRIGQDLIIPGRSVRLTRRHLRHIVFSHRIYKVQSGDSIDKIAHKFHASRKQVIKWNHLGHEAMIHPGQKLLIYTAN